MKYQISSPNIRGIFSFSLFVANIIVSLFVLKWLKRRLWKHLNLKNVAWLFLAAFKESLRFSSR